MCIPMLVVIATDKYKPTIISQPTVSRGGDILVLHHFIQRERERERGWDGGLVSGCGDHDGV